MRSLTPIGSRLVRACTVVLAGALAVAGCASPSPDSDAVGQTGCFMSGSDGSVSNGGATNSGKVTISFMETMIGAGQKPALQHLTDEFERANPGITVNLEGSPDYKTLQQNERDATAAKKPPTIAQMYEGVAADFARSGVIDSLDSYVGNARTGPLSTLYGGVRDDLKLCDGKVWMWPFSKSVYVNFYNADLLKRDNQPVPATWDQFTTVAKAVSRDGITAISIDPGGVGSITTGTVWLEILADSFGTPVFDNNGNPQFASPAAIKAMRYLLDLKNAGALATGKGYAGELALGGQRGMFDISSVAGYTYESQAVGGRFSLGTADLPAGPTGKVNQMNGGNIVLFSAASPAEKLAAWKYLRFLSSAQSQAYWATHTGYLPITPSALPLMTQFTSANPWMITGANALETAAGGTAVPWADKAQSELGIAVADVLQNNTSPPDALNKAQAAAQRDMRDDQ